MRWVLALCVLAALAAGCGQSSPPPPPSSPAPASQPDIQLGPAVRAPETPRDDGVLAYYGAVVHGWIRAREQLRQVEAQQCFQAGLALHFGQKPKDADEVKQMLLEGGYQFSRLPAGWAITYDPDVNNVFVIRRADASGP
jgi:hypothetical protein